MKKKLILLAVTTLVIFSCENKDVKILKTDDYTMDFQGEIIVLRNNTTRSDYIKFLSVVQPIQLKSAKFEFIYSNHLDKIPSTEIFKAI